MCLFTEYHGALTHQRRSRNCALKVAAYLLTYLLTFLFARVKGLWRWCIWALTTATGWHISVAVWAHGPASVHTSLSASYHDHVTCLGTHLMTSWRTSATSAFDVQTSALSVIKVWYSSLLRLLLLGGLPSPRSYKAAWWLQYLTFWVDVLTPIVAIWVHYSYKSSCARPG